MILKTPFAIGLLALSFLTANGQETASAPITRGQSIYACHHSYFLPVPALLTEMARAGGFPDQIIVGTHMIGASKSIQHWNAHDAANRSKEVLGEGKLDVLILTPCYLPDDGIGNYAQLGFDHNPAIRVTVMEAWPAYDIYNPTVFDPNYQRHPGEPAFGPKLDRVERNKATKEALETMQAYYFRTMDEHIAALNKKLGKQVVFVVPAGQAVIALREKIIDGQAPGLKTQEDLFLDPIGHPKPPLAVLESYCHYAVIYRKSPVGLPVPAALAKAAISAGDLEPLNRLLQQVAWDAVIRHPLSGVTEKRVASVAR